MTGNQILTLVKKRVKNTTTAVDWESLFQIVIDDIFSRENWKFSQRQLNYIHTGGVFEKTFDDDPNELALTRIRSIRYSRSFAGNPPSPVTNSGRPLDYMPLPRFMELFPDQSEFGEPQYWTELHGSDGSTGMQIGIYKLAADDFAVWIDGDFIPVIDIGDTEIPILPRQFHRLIIFGVVMHAADENGQDKLSLRAERWYEQGLEKLFMWDRRQPLYWPVKRAYDTDVSRRKGPYLPNNFPSGVGMP